MPKTLVAHPGTQHAYVLAAQLHKRQALYQLWTGFALAERSGLGRLVRAAPGSIRGKFAKRIVYGLTTRELRTFPWLEFKALRQLSRGEEPELVMFERNARFQELIPDGSIENADVVIGFDTSSWLLANRTKTLGKQFVLEQTTAHPLSGRAAWVRAVKDFPDWSKTVPATSDLLLQNQGLEHARADWISVPSSFARETLLANGVSKEKIRVNPYGVDLAWFSDRKPPRSGPLRFVFVGAISARKGVPVLLDAWRKLKATEAELWFVGGISEQVRPLIPNLPNLRLLGKRPPTELHEILRSSDVFVFPSYCEGFGLVLLEAMAAGLPVITTTATAGPDIVTEGADGFIIEPGNLDALVSKMEFCLQNRDRVTEMGERARATAERFSWNAYGDRWEGILKEVGDRRSEDGGHR